MGWLKTTSAMLLCSVLFCASAYSAEKGSITVCDFESGLPSGWELKSGEAELENYGNNTTLELGKNGVMQMGNEEYLNFSIEAVLRREYKTSGSRVGFQFRNGYKVYLRKPGRVELLGPNNARGRGFSRNINTDKPLKFRIVVAGPVVRFFVNGRYEGQFDNLESVPGPISLYQKGTQHNVYFDNIKLNTRIKPGQYLACEPVPGADNSLVFDPSEDVNLKLKVTNHFEAAQDAELGVNVTTFDDKPIFSTTTAPKNIASGAAEMLSVNLGKLPEGFYQLTFMPTGKMAPMAIHVKGTVTEDQYVKPKILTGVYWYYFGFQGLPEMWWNTYMHAACNDLRNHNFNTIIGSMGFPTDSIKIAGQYGIRCFTRQEGAGGNVADPNVLGGFIGDEPHKGDEEVYINHYTRLIEKYPDKIWTTCMIADHGVEGCQDWWDTWMPLSENNNVVRMVRWYGIKKFIAGIKRTYSSLTPVTELLRDLSKGKGDYYFIMPSFGGNEGGKSYFSNPLPSQIRAMMHLGAAHQATGLFFWTYQTPFPDHDAFVEPATLLPLDGKWAAAGDAAGKIMDNVDLLSECEWDGRYSFIDAPNLMVAFILRRKDDPAQYFYVINMDTENPAKGSLFELDPKKKLTNLFNGEDIQITKGRVQFLRDDLVGDTHVAHISLLAGDGVLLKYEDVEGGDAAASEALPRVTYPKEVANAPEGKIVWCKDIEPLEMPNPGWFPQVKFKNKTWYPDYHSNDIKLYSGPEDDGQLYKNSLWAHAETTIKYDVPEGAEYFAAAAGFGNKAEQQTAAFRVIVDGEEKYNSGIMKLGSAVQPVVVNVSGAKKITLKTEEAGDGLYGDYTFWGEARFIKK